MSSALYHIAVRMTMANNVSPILHIIGRDLLNLGTAFNHAALHANRFRTALAAAGTAFVATQSLQGLGHMIDKGQELMRIMNQMRSGGWSPEMIEKARINAFGLARTYRSVSAQDIMEMTREMAPVLGNRDEAIHVAEPMTRLLQGMQLQFGADRASMFHRQVRDAVRAAELSANTLTHDRFENYLNFMMRSLTAFGGTVTPSDFMMATKYGRASALNWSDEFTGQILPTIIQELGGSSAGTAFMSMYAALIGGVMSQRSIHAWDKLGLIDHTKLDPANLTAEGRIRRLSPGAITGSYDFMSNPYRWMQGELVPRLLQHGIVSQAGLDLIRAGDIKDGLGQETMRKMTAYLAIMFGNRTAQGMADLLALQPRKIERDSALVQGASGLRGQYDPFGTWIPGIAEVAAGDYGLAKLGLSQAWKDLNNLLALPNMKVATEGLTMLSGVLGEVGKIVQGMDPSTLKALVVGVAGSLGVVLVTALGALAAAVLGPIGLIITAVGSLAFVAGAFLYFKWDQLKGWASGFASKIGDALMSIPSMVLGAIQAMAAGIGNAISGALRSLIPGGGGGPMVPGFTPLPDSGGGDAVPRLQNWRAPPRSGGVIQTVTQLNLDGYRLGQAVAYHIAQATQHVSSAAQFDGSMSHMPVDLQAT